jgi:hypothetical protein
VHWKRKGSVISFGGRIVLVLFKLAWRNEDDFTERRAGSAGSHAAVSISSHYVHLQGQTGKVAHGPEKVDHATVSA